EPQVLPADCCSRYTVTRSTVMQAKGLLCYSSSGCLGLSGRIVISLLSKLSGVSRILISTWATSSGCIILSCDSVLLALLKKSVAIEPGQKQVTLMPSYLSSLKRASLKPRRPNLEAL